MTQQKKPPFGPRIEVIRRPAGTPSPTPAPRAVQPVPHPSPTPVVSEGNGSPAPRVATPTRVERPMEPRGRSGVGAPRAPGAPGRFPPRRGPPRPPPTQEQIIELARRERVPTRIAKGDLEGKMKCRIWRKLHAEEAKRFDDSYALLEKHPELDLADAFGVIQSGRSVEEFLARKARGKVKAEIKEARGSLPGETVDAWLRQMIENKEELSVTFGDRTVVDRLLENQPVAFVLERLGRVEKLQVVAMARREVWEQLAPTLDREPRLTRKPVAVQRQPDRRPVADPRVFAPEIGKRLRFELRNGIRLEQPLLKVGPFDVLIGSEGHELFVPLHAMLKWEAAA